MDPFTESEGTRLTAGVRDALAALESGRAKLLRPDGTPRYAAQEHAEQESQLLETFDRVVAAAQERAQATIDEAERGLAALNQDPLTRLSAEELQRANGLREFVREDVERLQFRDLLRYIEDALATGDRPLWLVLERCARIRLEMLQPGASDRLELDDLLRSLRTRLADPAAPERRKTLEAQQELARKLRKDVGTLADEGRRTQERLRQQLRSSGLYAAF